MLGYYVYILANVSAVVGDGKLHPDELQIVTYSFVLQLVIPVFFCREIISLPDYAICGGRGSKNK